MVFITTYVVVLRNPPGSSLRQAIDKDGVVCRFGIMTSGLPEDDGFDIAYRRSYWKESEQVHGSSETVCGMFDGLVPIYFDLRRWLVSFCGFSGHSKLAEVRDERFPYR